jgi:hypothetical protein
MFSFKAKQLRKDIVTVARDAEVLNKELHELRGQVNQLRAAAAAPQLQALLDEYLKFGGVAGVYSVCADEPGINGPMYTTYCEWGRVLTKPVLLGAPAFKLVLDGQKARWAEQHQCLTGKRK